VEPSRTTRVTRTPWLLLSAALFLPDLTLAQTTPLASATVTVGRNIQVSSALPNVAHDEVLIAADPTDAAHLGL